MSPKSTASPVAPVITLTPEQLSEMISMAVSKAIAAIPAPVAPVSVKRTTERFDDVTPVIAYDAETRTSKVLFDKVPSEKWTNYLKYTLRCHYAIFKRYWYIENVVLSPDDLDVSKVDASMVENAAKAALAKANKPHKLTKSEKATLQKADAIRALQSSLR